MKDKRKSRRAPLDVYMNKYVSGVPYLSRTSDISPDGIRIEKLIEPSHAQKRVGLQFQLPGTDEVIYAEGELLRGYEAATGRDASPDRVRFTLLTERHKKLIRSYVAEQGETH
ncbi:MAG: PilZ domain-containing protein [Myxococcaceae bacterium]